jgi:hypothetical protein
MFLNAFVDEFHVGLANREVLARVERVGKLIVEVKVCPDNGDFVASMKNLILTVS